MSAPVIKAVTATCDRLVREEERQNITSISRSQAWKLEREGKFPPRKTIGKKSCGWLLSDLLWWISQY
ncbi:helix-turn-helix transcriptional regulator [Escherichia coli]|uniref:helix-turn-helix transcriptional regulator n=1 Tax=Escherichia coli TaxID=562 RepID=UPI00092F04A5|nr:AlpA family phage regulatory protein [Escherichia coli]